MAKRCRAKVLQASTSEVYGDPKSIRSGVVPRQRQSDRAAGLLRRREAAAEDAVHGLSPHESDQHPHRADLQHLRPRMHPFDGRVVSNFIRQALCGEDITIFGDGSQTRSFCYRDDLVEGLIRMMDAPDEFIGPCNLGNPHEFTVRQLAEMVVELTGAKSKIVYEPLPADDPTRRQPDITLARTNLGWEPKTQLREGLTKTIDWFQKIKLTDYRPPTPNY
jgi:UDP-glucuronate decarboxylase